MQHIRLEQLRESKYFLENIRWDVTPKIFLEPRLTGAGNEQQEQAQNNINGYMLYVDVVYNRPGLVIMKIGYSMSKTVAYVEDIPEDLLNEAADCSPEKCVAGMYPLTQKLEDWLKKALGLVS